MYLSMELWNLDVGLIECGRQDQQGTCMFVDNGTHCLMAGGDLADRRSGREKTTDREDSGRRCS
jgi:hypothetical protein